MVITAAMIAILKRMDPSMWTAKDAAPISATEKNRNERTLNARCVMSEGPFNSFIRSPRSF